jgi:hypothetical protein
MNDEESGNDVFQGIIPALRWRNWQKSGDLSHVFSVSAEIRTDNLSNTSHKRYRLNQFAR